MGVYKRKGSPYYYCDFIIGGKRVTECTKMRTKTQAKEVEQLRRREMEQVLAGIPVDRREKRIRDVSDAVTAYLSGFAATHREKTTVNVRGRLAHVVRVMGSTILADASVQAVQAYIGQRKAEGASGRTINMEVAELSRAIGKPWSQLWPKLRKLDERTDVGKALSPEEQSRLVQVLDSTRSELGSTFVRIALLTGMRYSEILGLTWERVDLAARVVTVGAAKTAAGTGRQIPMNDSLYAVLQAHAEWYRSKFGQCRNDWFVFPYGSPRPSDPARATTTMKTFWRTVRKRADVHCRFHDLRHTVATNFAEAGVSESTMMAILGHMSRKMLERYSHIRMAAKRDAMAFLTVQAQPVPSNFTSLSVGADSSIM